MTVHEAYNLISKMVDDYNYDEKSIRNALNIFNKYYPYNIGLESLNKIIKELFVLERESYAEIQKETLKKIINIMQSIV